ncbi:MAG: hypothetical protein EU529_00845 [Promethearchaeota archaeon]|nr:MAG: hypothetical protein EU529_00845 [Candidatus Lokiarchaeota archaeon]
MKILKYNSNIELFDESKELKERVRIPLTPIETDGNIVYYLFELLYPIFINEQQNILDFVISDNEDEILKLILYETKKAGVHESYQILPKDLIKSKKIDLDNLNDFFNIAQSVLMKKNNIRFSSLRIFKNKALEYINNFCIGLEDRNFHEFIQTFLELIHKIFEQNIFYIYPEPNIYKFLKKLILFLNGVKLNNVFKFLVEKLAAFNVSIILNSEKLILILKFQKINSGSDLTFQLYTPRNLGINIDGISKKRLMNLIKFKLKAEKVYFFNQNHVISLLSSIFELEFPLKIENLIFILQKVLFGFRSFENHWYMVPRPKIYNPLRRFLIRLFGITLNLKKISHWAIPELIFNSINSNFGLNSKNLLILTNISKYKKGKTNGLDFLEKVFRNALLIEIENRRIININPINRKDLFINGKSNNLETIKSQISEKYGVVSTVIKIDSLLVNEIINKSVSNLSKFKPFSKLKVIKMFKNKNFFNIYPEIPPYKLMMGKRIKSLTKLILRVFIDKHEF